MNKSDDGSHSKEAKGLNASPARTDRAEESSSHAGDERRSSNDESNTTEIPKTDPEAAGQESNTGSDIQGQEPASVVTLISFQTTPEAIGQTEVRPEAEVQVEEGGNQGGAMHSSGSDAQASGDSSKSALTPLATTDSPSTVSDPAEGASPPNKISTPSRGLPEQELDATAVQPKHDSQAAQVIKQSLNVIVDDSGSEAANLANNPPVPVESQPDPTFSHPDSVARRAFQAYLAAVSSNGKSEPSKPDSGKHEEVLDDHPGSTQSNRYAQSLDDHEDIGVTTRWVFPHGQQPSVDLGEHFNELWADQNSLRADHAVPQLPQAAVVDPQVANGQPAGPVVAGVHNQSLSGSMTPFPTASFASQPQSLVPAHDTAEQPVRLMTRSVVLDLARPDLGHVNIRVAMTNDVVHTHLLADRPEVGQFLINGQDRLQAAFQANGLDMGQFRVDIDRQGAGRSFQQGQFQEQGQAWNQGSHGMEHEHGHRDRQDEPHVSLHGLLNLVA
ncbi:MAG: flagellar hook-length control protein FliK [Nitrospira sp.]|nr:flagellar hook-length control protein FliK [Nitrospira sp.]